MLNCQSGVGVYLQYVCKIIEAITDFDMNFTDMIYPFEFRKLLVFPFPVMKPREKHRKTCIPKV